MHKLGIMGYSAQEFDKGLAEQYIRQHFSELGNDIDIEIVSGLTNIGIPAIAYRVAKEMGFTTTGIACSKAEKYECFPCDQVKIIGNNWGDESSTFLSYCDSFLRVGGGEQTKKETADAKALGKTIKEYDL